MKIITGFVLGIALLWSAFASAAEYQGPATESPQIILVADEGGGLPLTEILRLEPGHLLALGLGVIAGAVVFGPYLGTGEVVGVAIGVLSGEIFYRSRFWPLEKPHGWFD